MRKLNIIPIIHSRQDLGSLDLPIQEFKNKLLSKTEIQSSRSVVGNFWKELRLGIEGWQVEFEQLMLYQDAIPFTGHMDGVIEQQIVRELSAKGSPNHQLLEWLMDQGATLVGTESAELLLKEYDVVRKSLADGFQGFGDDLSSEPIYSVLLEQRDRFIADRIFSSLQENKVGVLFIGMLHRVENYLDASIVVHHPFGKPKTLSKIS